MKHLPAVLRAAVILTVVGFLLYLVQSCEDELRAEAFTDYSGFTLTMDKSVQDTLEAQWQAYVGNPYETEHGYCLTDYSVLRTGSRDVAMHVRAITHAVEEKATPVSLMIDCGGLPILHTHPPTICDTDDRGDYICRAFTDTARLCAPSARDIETLRTEWHRVGVIQCGPNTFSVVTVVR